MPVVNLRKRSVFVWIPPTTTAAYKIEVIRSDGTVDDITGIIVNCMVEDGVNEGTGLFEFTIWDPDETYANAWTGNEIFKYYKDYSADATTLRFRGRITKPSKRGLRLNVKGKSEGNKILQRKITYQASETETSVILQAILTASASEFTQNNINTSNTSLTVNWYEKPLNEAILELVNASGFDFYIDSALDAHYFEQGTVINTNEAIVHDYNLLEIEDFTPDLDLIKNRITVYGAVIDGIQILHTESSTDPDYGVSSAIGVREEVINDENVTTQTQAEERADFELSQRIDPPEVGNVKGMLLATIQPGNAIRLSSPQDKLPPGNYITTGYKDIIDTDNGETSTTVRVNKEPRTVSFVIRDRITAENEQKQASLNPDGLDFSFNFLFNNDSGIHDKTQITEGVLKLQAGESSGTWISQNKTLTSALNEAYLRLIGTLITGATVSISGDNGVNYQTMSNNSKITLSTAKGNNIRIKVEITDSTTEIDSLGILYSRD